MALHTEPVDGGLVTSRDPSLLNPGELASCSNALYEPNSPSLHRAPGHSLFGTVSASSSVQGLVAIKFDNGNHYLIGETSGGVRSRAPVGDTGSFTTIESGLTSGNWLEALHYQNRYFLLNGANPNRVSYLAATAVATTPSFRAMGMQPTTVTPAAVTAAGVWSASVIGWYEYWTTEVAEIVQDGATVRLESTFGSDPFDPNAVEVLPASVQITAAATQSVRITRPVPANASSFNSTATYWRVYRSAKKENETDTLFPTGYLLAELPISTESFLDGVAATATANCTTATNVAGWDASSGTLAASVTSSNNVYAQVTAGTFNNVLRCHGFTAYSTAPSDPIAGIEVLVEAKTAVFPTNSKLSVALTNDGGTTITPYKQIQLTSSDTIYTVGSPSDNWGFPWTAAQVTSTNFGVMLRVSFFNDNVSVDHVRVRVHFNGTPATSSEVFPAVILNVGGEQSAVGSHGPPPTSSTGDIFEDSLVLNDVNFPSLLRWSLAGEVEYFPWFYFYDFETPDNDQVTCIKTLGNRLIIGLRNSLWRMNYLPNEDDARFSRGKAVDLISPNHGIVNPKAATHFTDADGRTALAFVSPTNVLITDGFSFHEATPDVRWSEIFASLSMFSGGVVELHNDPTNWVLRLYLTDTTLFGGTILYRLHYHPSHLKQGGGMKVSGPQYLTHDGTGTDVRSVTVVPRSTGIWSTYTGYKGTGVGGGGVFMEDGFNIPVSNDGTYDADVKTRTMYLNNFGNEFKADELYLHHSNPQGAKLQFYMNLHNTGESEQLGTVPTEYTQTFNGFTKLPGINTMSDAISYTMTDNSGSPAAIDDWTLDYMVIRWDGFTRET